MTVSAPPRIRKMGAGDVRDPLWSRQSSFLNLGFILRPKVISGTKGNGSL
ncbi:MAG: hypothetical protein IPJ46_18140 [Anaerolineales bacterium]|nr:hypothetical protein [Anaerolineales bacterium]